ncbi:MAG: 2-oxo acid dehydrogenase subunit E2 [Actinobacteria bacterium]|nr:2-oxo acid dehydrogenase subunit E2 [Actinomycetota bacterium]
MNNFKIIDPYLDNEIIEEKRLHGSRKVIAEHLMSSYKNKIHASMFRYIEIEKLRVFTNKIRKGSIIDHFMKAVALSLSEKPELNGTFDGEVYRIFKHINLCYAVNTKRGLVTPVIKNADLLSIDEFCNKRRELISLVMEWKQEKKDILGGTFTITNLGNFGVDFTLPIINPPQVAILGIARMCKLNITWDLSESPTVKELMPINITYDHSVIDGVGVSEFAQLLQDKVNNPDNLWNSI